MMRCLLVLLAGLLAFGTSADAAISVEPGQSSTRVSFAWDMPTVGRMAQAGRTVMLRFDRPVVEDLVLPFSQLAGLVTDLRRGGTPNEILIELALGVRASMPAQAGTNLTLTLIGPKLAPRIQFEPTAAPEWEAATTIASVPPQVIVRRPAPKPAMSPGKGDRRPLPPRSLPEPAAGPDADPVHLAIRWKRPVPAAIFERGGLLWLVFRARESDLVAVEQGPSVKALSRVEPDITTGDLTVIRFAGAQLGALGVSAEKAGWLLRPTTSQPALQPAPEELPASDASLLDPDSGEMLHLNFTMTGATSGRVSFDREVYPGLAGLAWRDLADIDTIAAEVPAPSAAVPTPSADEVLPGKPMSIGLAGLDTAGLVGRRQALQRSLRPGAMHQERLELARLFLADGLGAEARTLLNTSAAATKEGDPGRLLRAAAMILTGQPRQTLELTAEGDAEADPEVALWRMMAAVEIADWALATAELKKAGTVWRSYPPRLRPMIGEAVIRTLVEARRINEALVVLDLLGRETLEPAAEARLQLLKARILDEEGRTPAAKKALAVALDQGASKTRIEADFTRVQLAMNRKEMSVSEGLEQLRQQRPTWRGLPESWRYLDVLAGLEAETGQPTDALSTWRMALEGKPPANEADAIRARMRERLETLMTTNDEHADPITAYALQSAYGTPLGISDDTAATQSLAARLQSSGLADTAATLATIPATEKPSDRKVDSRPVENEKLRVMLEATTDLPTSSASVALQELDARLKRLNEGMSALRSP